MEHSILRTSVVTLKEAKPDNNTSIKPECRYLTVSKRSLPYVDGRGNREYEMAGGIENMRWQKRLADLDAAVRSHLRRTI